MITDTLEIIRYAVRIGDSLLAIALRYGTTVEKILGANPDVDFHMVPAGLVIQIPKELPAADAPQNRLRALWAQNAFWTRLVLLGISAGLPDADIAAARLLRTAAEMEDTLRPALAGEAARTGSLLTAAFAATLRLMRAAVSRDGAAAAKAEGERRAAADAAARQISAQLPRLPYETLRDALFSYQALVGQEIAARSAGDFAADLSLYDALERQAFAIGDMIGGALPAVPEDTRHPRTE